MRVSVVVPTRNRPKDLPACLETILLCNPFELIVVDQSDVPAPHTPDDPRIRWIRSAPRGVCFARNLGIAASTGEIIANTDDDCRVPPQWIARITALFENDPQAALVCGRVHLPEGAVGFGASFEPQQRDYRGELPPVWVDWGISANLAVRRFVLDKVGHFDGLMGVGSPLRSGGETELIIRVLRAGFKVVNAKEIDVLHLGVRPPGKPSGDLYRQYAYGTAAGLMKHIRLRDPVVAGLFVRTLGGYLRWNLSILRGVRPSGVSQTLAFLTGAVTSFRFRVDRATRMYAARS